MNATAIEEHRFYWPSQWRKLGVGAGLCVLAIAIGMGLGLVAEQVVLATESFFPACLIGLLAVSIDFVGFVGLFVVAEHMTCHSMGKKFDDGLAMVNVRPDRIWITRGVELFPKTDVIPYPEIAWVNSEYIPRGKQCIRIVYGSGLKTTFVSGMHEPDFEVLLNLLKERCPTAFTPDPPVGYTPSPYPQTTPPWDRLVTDPNSSHVFQFGPKTYRAFVVSTLLTFVGIALVGMCCYAAMIMGVQGALSVPLGSGSLFFGFGFVLLVREGHWTRLLRATLNGKRRGELHLTAHGITLLDLISRQEPTRIVFDSICAMRSEPSQKAIWIVGGSESDTVTIPWRWMEKTDCDALLAQLMEYRPEAFLSPFRMFSFGPSLQRQALFTSIEMTPFAVIVGAATWLLVESLSWGGWWIILSIYLILTVLNCLFGSLFPLTPLVKRIVRYPRRPGILIITGESLTILMDGIFVRQEHLPFKEIRYVTAQNCRGVERLWISYWEHLTTLQFSQTWFTPTDYVDMVSLLRASVPEAFNPDPPIGWQPPKYSRYPAFDLCE